MIMKKHPKSYFTRSVFAIFSTNAKNPRVFPKRPPAPSSAAHRPWVAVWTLGPQIGFLHFTPWHSVGHGDVLKVSEFQTHSNMIVLEIAGHRSHRILIFWNGWSKFTICPRHIHPFEYGLEDKFPQEMRLYYFQGTPLIMEMIVHFQGKYTSSMFHHSPFRVFGYTPFLFTLWLFNIALENGP